MRKHKLFLGCAAAALLLAAMAFAAQQNVSPIRAISPAGVPINPSLSNGILVGNTLYVAGLQGKDASGHLVKGGIGPQTSAVLENVRAVLRAGGFSLHDVVSVNVYLADISDYGVMNKLYDSFFPNPRPARTTVQAGALAGGARVEISAVAVKQ